MWMHINIYTLKYRKAFIGSMVSHAFPSLSTRDQKVKPVDGTLDITELLKRALAKSFLMEPSGLCKSTLQRI